MPRHLSVYAGLVILAAVAPAAHGQTRGTTGQNGQGSSGTGSSSMFGNTGSSLGSSSGLGNSGLGNSGLGQTGQGGLGQNSTGFGQNRNTNGLTGNNQNNGFLGVNNNPNNFIGRNNQNGQTGNQNGQTGNLGRQNRGGNNRQLDSNLMNAINGGNQGGNNSQQQQPVIRPRQKIAFEYPQPKLDAIVTATQTRIEKLAGRYPHLADVKLDRDADGTIVLRGSSPSQADARVAENMIRLEPGVRKIRNELTYPPPRPEAN